MAWQGRRVSRHDGSNVGRGLGPAEQTVAEAVCLASGAASRRPVGATSLSGSLGRSFGEDDWVASASLGQRSLGASLGASSLASSVHEPPQPTLSASPPGTNAPCSMTAASRPNLSVGSRSVRAKGSWPRSLVPLSDPCALRHRLCYRSLHRPRQARASSESRSRSSCAVRRSPRRAAHVKAVSAEGLWRWTPKRSRHQVAGASRPSRAAWRPPLLQAKAPHVRTRRPHRKSVLLAAKLQASHRRQRVHA
jgi:hypothetical protein